MCTSVAVVSACNMQCLSPLSIPRHGGAGAGDRQQVPCGKCMACLQTKRTQWSYRLNEHLRVSKSAYFITITYEDSSLPLEQVHQDTFVPVVVKRDVQLFLKRLRKTQKGKISYYLVSEYGSITHRPHYHAIMFDLDGDIVQATDCIMKAWQKGHVSLGSVTNASIHYVTKYAITKGDYPANAVKPFALISKGLGKNYIERCRSYHDGNLERSYVVSENGFKAPLPRYYAERLYSKEERETMSQIKAKHQKSPEEMFPNSKENPFKRLADAKTYFAEQTLKTTKSKII